MQMIIKYASLQRPGIKILTALLAICIAVSLGKPANAQVEQSMTLKVGYTSFRSASYLAAQKKSSYQSFHDYLQAIARHSHQKNQGDPDYVPLDFQISVGNYYQVYEWLRNGDIDAALVSPFTAGLLISQRVAVPVVEFPEHGDKHADSAGQCPLITAAVVGNQTVDPVAIYRDFLGELLKGVQARREGKEHGKLVTKLRSKYDLGFVSHLSSSGFVAPMMFAASWLEQEKRVETIIEKDETLYWSTLLNVADFKLFHGSETNDHARITLRFSYSGRRLDDLVDRPKEFSEWHAYNANDAKSEGHVMREDARCGENMVVIPNDVLVVRSDHPLVDRFESAGVDTPFLVDIPTDIFTEESGYTGVHRHRYSEHRAFRKQAKRLFSEVGEYSELTRNHQRWFLDGRFQFRIDETLDILEHDRDILNQNQTENSVDLSLVLPGGGVKALYQAVIIDKLYDDCRIQNVAFHGGTCADESPLLVKNVIGTSGGAMVGMMVAHQTPNLEEVFRGAVGAGLFPFLDFPRWGSLIVLGVIFAIFLALFRMPERSPFHMTMDKSELHRVPGSVAVFVLALFFLTPIAVRYMRIEESGSIPLTEGALYFMLGLICHCALTCVGRRTTTSQELKGLSDFQGDVGSTALATVALVCYASAAFGDLFLDRDPLDDSGRRVFAILIMLGSIFLVAALLRRTAEPSSSLCLYHLRRYRNSIGLVTAYVIATYFVVLILVWIFEISFLELTPEFWFSLLSASAVVSLVILIYGYYIVGRVRTAIAFLGTRFFRESFRFSMYGRLLVLFSLGYLVWFLFVAPALYSSANAWGKFFQATEDIDKNLSANLVVTGALLQKQSGMEEGDLYFCFAVHGTDGCKSANLSRWIELPGVPAEMLDPVFASGSPFPVFPPHLVNVEGIGALRIVDGGFAHNVPLEAASILNSRQVLIIRSSPLEEPRSRTKSGIPWLSQFVRYGGRIFPFLFDRAQEVDQRIASGLIVASLAPVLRPGEESFPILTSFTKTTIDRMVRVAQSDIEEDRRIGTIEYWGQPTFSGVIVDDRSMSP